MPRQTTLGIAKCQQCGAPRMVPVDLSDQTFDCAPRAYRDLTPEAFAVEPASPREGAKGLFGIACSLWLFLCIGIVLGKLAEGRIVAAVLTLALLIGSAIAGGWFWGKVAGPANGGAR
jgi:hypothetical protein